MWFNSKCSPLFALVTSNETAVDDRFQNNRQQAQNCNFPSESEILWKLKITTVFLILKTNFSPFPQTKGLSRVFHKNAEMFNLTQGFLQFTQEVQRRVRKEFFFSWRPQRTRLFFEKNHFTAASYYTSKTSKTAL